MVQCDYCKKIEGKIKLKDKTTGEIKNWCTFCDEPKNVEVVIEETYNIEEHKKPVKKDPDGWGRLHLVKKTLKEASCRICSLDIPVGSSCYNQAQHLEKIHIQKKVCMSCSEDLIKEGTIVAP